MDQTTRKLISDFSPMWTNKQVWEFDQTNEELTFDFAYIEPGDYTDSIWASKNGSQNSNIHDVTLRLLEYFEDDYELWIANKGAEKLDEKYMPYLMAVLVDAMINDEVCLNFRMENGFLVVRVDENADVVDCKEFFEEFYHLATGFNYEDDTGIPDDETEAEIYLTRLQQEFDDKMKSKLGDKYLPENGDPDTINAVS